MSTLAAIIPDPAGLGVANAEFPGVPAPALTSALFVRNAPAACASCDKRISEHKVWETLGLWTRPGYGDKAAQLELIAPGNAQREAARVLQSLSQLMHLIANGIFSSTVYGIDYRPPSSAFDWEVDGVSGTTVTLKYQTGDSDPRNVSWMATRENPDWAPGSETEDRYETFTYHGALRPRGILTMNFPSQLSGHYGWVVKKFVVADDLAVGGTFQIELEMGIGSMATSKMLNQTAAIRATYSVYLNANENQVIPRDCLPQWVAYQEITLTAGELSNTVILFLASAAVRLPSGAEPWWLGVYVLRVGGWTADAALALLVSTENDGAGGVNSNIDLTAYDLDGVLAIKIECFADSDSADAINAGQDRCQWAYQDYSESWGDVEAATGRYYYCAAGEALRALGAPGTAFLDLFQPRCCLSECPLYAQDYPTDANDADMWTSIILAHPWLEWQPTPGYPVFALARPGAPSGAPGLASLAGMDLFTHPGYHAVMRPAFQSGGWPQIGVTVVDGQTLMALYSGLAFQVWAGQTLLTPATWPPYGPGGNLWARLSESIPAAAAGDTDDPHQLFRGQVMGAIPDLAKYNLLRMGTLGTFQRWADYTLWFPVVPTLTAGQTFTTADGVITAGWWDSKFRAQGAEDINTVYRAMIQFTKSARGHRTSAQEAQAYGGLATTATIKSAALADGALTAALAHKMTSATTQTATPQTEISTTWMQGATNVAAHESCRPQNYGSGLATLGPSQTGFVRAGCAIGFDNAQFDNTILAGKRFLMTAAKACGSAVTDSWKPDARTEKHGARLEGYYFVQYATLDESYTSITITRNSGAVTLTRIENYGQHIFDLGTDEYYVIEGNAGEGESETRGLYIFFSQLHDIGGGDTSFYSMSITVVTDVEYGPTEVNLAALWRPSTTTGPTTREIIVNNPAADTIDGIALVRIVGDQRDPDTGELEAFTLTAYDTPPALFYAWDKMKYAVVATSSTSRTIRVSPEWAGAMLEVTLTLAGEYSGTEAEFYDAVIGIHNGLPNDHETTFNRCDQIVVTDEAGAIASYLAEFGAGALADAPINVYYDPCAHPATHDLFSGGPSISDSEIEESEYAFFGAWGVAFLKNPIGYLYGKCFWANLKVGDRSCIGLNQEMIAARTCAEKILAG